MTDLAPPCCRPRALHAGAEGIGSEAMIDLARAAFGAEAAQQMAACGRRASSARAARPCDSHPRLSRNAIAAGQATLAIRALHQLDKSRDVQRARQGDHQLHQPLIGASAGQSSSIACTRAISIILARIGSAWLDPAYITPATRAAFWTPQKLVSGEINEQSYAIGWRANPNLRVLGEDKPVWNVHHGGVSKGAYSWLVIYPEQRLVVALNANARLDGFEDFMAIERAISRVFLTMPHPGE